MQPPPKLTPREQEILPFLTSGANRNEIANHFGLSAETVKRHTRNILAKFGAKTLRDGMWDITDYLNNYGLPDPLYPLFAHKVVAEHVYDVDTRTMTVTHNAVAAPRYFGQKVHRH